MNNKKVKEEEVMFHKDRFEEKYIDHCYYEFTCDICNGDYQADRKFGDICPQCLTKNKGLSILVSQIKALSKDIKMLKEEKNKLKEHITQVEALLNNLCELLSLKRY